MNLIGKLQPVIIITAAFTGVASGCSDTSWQCVLSMIEVFLMMLLYILFLSIDGSRLKILYKHPLHFISGHHQLCFTPLVWLSIGRFSSPVLWIFVSVATDAAGNALYRLVSRCIQA